MIYEYGHFRWLQLSPFWLAWHETPVDTSVAPYSRDSSRLNVGICHVRYRKAPRNICYLRNPEFGYEILLGS